MNIKHEELVARLAKSGADIIAQLTPEAAHHLHMAVGVSGEAGELLDAVKKSAIYCKPIDMENVIEELGDIEFYMEGLRASLGITREQTLQANIEKLSKRYSSLSYSNEAAQERADKAEVTAPVPSASPAHYDYITRLTADHPQAGRTSLLFSLARGAISEGKRVLIVFPTDAERAHFLRHRLPEDLITLGRESENLYLLGAFNHGSFFRKVLSLGVDLILFNDADRGPKFDEDPYQKITSMYRESGEIPSIVVA